MDFIDLQFRGSPRVIATALLSGPDGVTLIDPGPTSCLPALEAGLRERGLSLRDVRTLLLTHIHLDHAGAAGTILERVPAIRVYVHEIGAPHMVDPARLLASATRLWGDQMDALWGAFLPVPQSQVTALAGGERLAIAGRSLQVAYTPGHAKHHVSFLDEQTGMAYVGDTGGIRIVGDYLLAPTPAPDINIEAWLQSLDRIDAWQPVSLFLAHFGAFTRKTYCSPGQVSWARISPSSRKMLPRCAGCTPWLRPASSWGRAALIGVPPPRPRARPCARPRHCAPGRGSRTAARRRRRRRSRRCSVRAG